MNRSYKEFDHYLRVSFLDSMGRTQGSLGRHMMQSQTAPYFLKSETHFKKKVRVPKHIRKMANDNFRKVAIKKRRRISLYVAAIVCASLMLVLFLNKSNTATYVVMNTDDHVLSAAAEVNPDAVAAVLNEMNIGE